MNATTSSIPELYTDHIETVGVVKRIFFYFRHEEAGVSTWYYFGTNPVDKPPTTPDPVIEFPYIQLPNDLDSLPPEESDSYLYELGLIAGLTKEGIEQ